MGSHCHIKPTAALPNGRRVPLLCKWLHTKGNHCPAATEALPSRPIQQPSGMYAHAKGSHAPTTTAPMPNGRLMLLTNMYHCPKGSRWRAPTAALAFRAFRTTVAVSPCTDRLGHHRDMLAPGGTMLCTAVALPHGLHQQHLNHFLQPSTPMPRCHPQQPPAPTDGTAPATAHAQPSQPPRP